MREIKRIVIAGAGTMGSSMAQTFAKHGYDVTLYDVFPAALEKAKGLIELNQKTEIAEQIVTEEQSKAMLERISYTADVEEFRKADFVVEAIVEKLEIKHKFWEQVSNLVDEQEMLFEVIHGGGVDSCLERLLEIAKSQGAPDNVTAVLMQKL